MIRKLEEQDDSLRNLSRNPLFQARCFQIQAAWYMFVENTWSSVSLLQWYLQDLWVTLHSSLRVLVSFIQQFLEKFHALMRRIM